MCRKIRHVPDKHTVEVTTRTIGGHYLLPPTPSFASTVIGVLARGKELHPVQLHAVVMLSNHMHLLITPAHTEELASFMGFVNGNIAKEALKIHEEDWEDKIWGHRYHGIVISNEVKAHLDRFRYLVGHGVKENLVERVAHWPGLHCGPALMAGRPLEGEWYDRSGEYEARRLQVRRGVEPEEVEVDAEDFGTHYSLELDPLPCWQHLPKEQICRRVTEMVAKIEAEAARKRVLSGKEVLGIAGILRQKITDRPNGYERSRAVDFHTASPEALKKLQAGYRTVCEAHREASARLRAGERGVEFPEGTFPPPLPFVYPVSPPPPRVSSPLPKRPAWDQRPRIARRFRPRERSDPG